MSKFVNSQQSTVNSQQSTVNSQQSTVNSQQSTVNSQQSTNTFSLKLCKLFIINIFKKYYLIANLSVRFALHHYYIIRIKYIKFIILEYKNGQKSNR